MASSETTGGQQGGRWRKGQSGNPAGRPKGARNKTTVAAESLLDGQAEALTRAAIERALAGDSASLRLCLERVVPPKRDRAVSVTLPPLKTLADAVSGLSTITDAISRGDLTPSEAEKVAGLLETFAKIKEVGDIEERVKALEAVLKAREAKA